MKNRLLVISPSKLNSFDAHIKEKWYGSVTKEKLIIDIKGLTEWKSPMVMGSAIHAMIEHGPEKYYDPATERYYVLDDGMPEVVEFTAEQIKPIKEHRARYPGMIHEIRNKWWIDDLHTVNGGMYRVMVNHRIDGMYGGEIHEHKSSDRQLKGSDFKDSVQWKVYCLGTDAAFCQYNTFQVKQLKNKPLEIIPNSFRFKPYPAMRDEVVTLVRRFVEFCERESLMEFVYSKY